MNFEFMKVVTFHQLKMGKMSNKLAKERERERERERDEEEKMNNENVIFSGVFIPLCVSR